MDKKKLKSAIRRQWDIKSLISDLRDAKWESTEPNRIDRRAWIGAYDTIVTMARDTFPQKEWREAAEEYMEDELVDEYLEALAETVSEAMGKELRREHVYATFEEGEAFVGQYEDMSAEELRAMGFEIGG